MPSTTFFEILEGGSKKKLKFVAFLLSDLIEFHRCIRFMRLSNLVHLTILERSHIINMLSIDIRNYPFNAICVFHEPKINSRNGISLTVCKKY